MQYETQREAIEATHSDADDFKNQWGLTTIRAAQAYAHLELEHGLDTAPGTGQTVGLIDTGIDTGHPCICRQDRNRALLFRGDGRDRQQTFARYSRRERNRGAAERIVHPERDCSTRRGMGRRCRYVRRLGGT